jgi:hypothetical protein
MIYDFLKFSVSIQCFHFWPFREAFSRALDGAYRVPEWATRGRCQISQGYREAGVRIWALRTKSATDESAVTRLQHDAQACNRSFLHCSLISEQAPLA